MPPALARALAALWALVIAALLFVPLPPENRDYLPGWLADLVVPGVDKLVHGLLFFVLAYLLLGALGQRSWRRLTAILLAVVYGGLTELLQPRISGRDGEWGDFVADSLGAILGATLVTLGVRLWQRRRGRQERSGLAAR